MLASAAAAWWVWLIAVALAVGAAFGLAKRKHVYVLLRGDHEAGQRHLGISKGASKRKNTDKDSEMI